jgi:sodium/hydrogen antiporter
MQFNTLWKVLIQLREVEGIIIAEIRKRFLESYVLVMAIIGLAALGMAWMPSLTNITKISYAIIYVLFGALLYKIFGSLLPLPDPISKNEFTVRLTELVVIISIMGTGLKIDQPFSLKQWAIPFRLVSITMVVSIVAVTLIGVYVLGFDLPSSLLLGAVLAPTDPVLASDVQVGPPLENSQDSVRFSLTAEAGMNDGSAFPFTWLAILLMISGTNSETIVGWLWFDLVYRLFAGVLMGFVIGRILAYLIFRLPEKIKDIKTRDGLVAISATLLVYGLTEWIHGYGFIAVFVTAITMRNFEMEHKYHRRMHDFTDQVERILMAVVLILFGGSLVTGILQDLTWPTALFGIIFVILIRPLTSFLSLFGGKLHIKEKMAISFFGIRGMGSFFYLSFALQQTFFPFHGQLWSIVSFIVLLSIIVHGLTATSVMRQLEHEFGEEVERNEVDFEPDPEEEVKQ